MSVGFLDLSLALPTRRIPELNGLVLCPRHNQPAIQTSASHCIGVPFELVHHRLCLEIPQRCSPVPPSSDHHPEYRMLDSTADWAFVAFLKGGNRIPLIINSEASSVLSGSKESGLFNR